MLRRPTPLFSCCVHHTDWRNIASQRFIFAGAEGYFILFLSVFSGLLPRCRRHATRAFPRLPKQNAVEAGRRRGGVVFCNIAFRFIKHALLRRYSCAVFSVRVNFMLEGTNGSNAGLAAGKVGWGGGGEHNNLHFCWVFAFSARSWRH